MIYLHEASFCGTLSGVFIYEITHEGNLPYVVVGEHPPQLKIYHSKNFGIFCGIKLNVRRVCFLCFLYPMSPFSFFLSCFCGDGPFVCTSVSSPKLYAALKLAPPSETICGDRH